MFWPLQASSFFIHAHTHNANSLSLSFTLTHTYAHITILLWLLSFLWPVSTGLPRDQSQAVDLPYHKMSVVWSKTALALLEILNLLCRYNRPLQLTLSKDGRNNITGTKVWPCQGRSPSHFLCCFLLLKMKRDVLQLRQPY